MVIATKAKIKIKDIVELRRKLDQTYEDKTQIELAKWALQLSKYIFSLIEYDYENESVIVDGFMINEKWQIGEARMHDVRQAGFKVHQLARESHDPVLQSAIRVAGQAIGTGHMKEHAMVASDYAVKVVNLKYPNDMEIEKNCGCGRFAQWSNCYKKRRIIESLSSMWCVQLLIIAYIYYPKSY